MRFGTGASECCKISLDRSRDHFDRADIRFARPNIQIQDARVVDLYQWGCARYLAGVRGAETKAKRG